MKYYIYYLQWNTWGRIKPNGIYTSFSSFDQATAFPNHESAIETWYRFSSVTPIYVNEEDALVISILNS